MDAQTDDELLGSWCAGNQESYAVLVARFHGLVRAACQRQAPAGEIDDCVQAVFLVLYRRPAAAAKAPALAAWLLRVSWNVCSGAGRAATRRHTAERAAAAQSPTTVAEPAHSDALAHLDDCLLHLPEQQRVAVSLQYFAGRSPDEVAASMGISRSNAYQLVNRGLAGLRDLLARRKVVVGAGALTGLLATQAQAAALPAPAAAFLAITTATPSVGAVALATGAMNAMTLSAAIPLIAAAGLVFAIGAATVALSGEGSAVARTSPLVTAPAPRPGPLKAPSATAAPAYDYDILFPPNVAKETSYSVFSNVKELGAKGDGTTDDTEVFKKAFALAHKEPKDWCYVYVPAGTYVVSDTIFWRHRGYLIGENQGRTIIKLKDRSAGYDKNKPVIRCLFNNNMSFHNYVINLTVDTGKGNPGAIGIRYNTHNSGVVGEVTIRSGDGAGAVGLDLSETEFGPGMIRNTTIEGFDIGIKTNGQPSSVALANITLRKQKVVGIENRFPLACKGLYSTNSVPVVRNIGGSANLVIVDGVFGGGDPAVCAIENSKGATAYLRNLSASGYQAVLKQDDAVVPGASLAEKIIGATKTVFDSPLTGLALPIEDPPVPFSEPMASWAIIEPSGSDDTKAIQDAIDGGAKTIFFRPLKSYTLSDTIHVRKAVRRIIGLGASLGGKKEVFVDQAKPMLRFDGDGSEPITVEWLGMGIWPHKITGIQVATAQPIALYSCNPGFYTETTPEFTGRLWFEEGISDLKLQGTGTVFIRQLNIENNPYTPGKSGSRTYINAKGTTVWVLSYKTEAPAIHGRLEGGAKMEVLGGFFRDHFGVKEAGGDVPTFVVNDSSLSATYFQYAHAPGKARELQAIVTKGSETREVRVGAGSFNMGLLSVGVPAGKTPAAP